MVVTPNAHPGKREIGSFDGFERSAARERPTPARTPAAAGITNPEPVVEKRQEVSVSHCQSATAVRQITRKPTVTVRCGPVNKDPPRASHGPGAFAALPGFFPNPDSGDWSYPARSPRSIATMRLASGGGGPVRRLTAQVTPKLMSIPSVPIPSGLMPNHHASGPLHSKTLNQPI